MPVFSTPEADGMGALWTLELTSTHTAGNDVAITVRFGAKPRKGVAFEQSALAKMVELVE